MVTERVPPALRRVVQARAANRCEYCRAPESFATQSFTIDHVHPRAAGGKGTLDNLAWACFGCNAHKHAAIEAGDRETGRTVRLYHPRRDIWEEHFRWGEGNTRVEGKTPLGRATIDTLHLNRAGLVNLRRVLAATGLHPTA